MQVSWPVWSLANELISLHAFYEPKCAFGAGYDYVFGLTFGGVSRWETNLDGPISTSFRCYHDAPYRNGIFPPFLSSLICSSFGLLHDCLTGLKPGTVTANHALQVASASMPCFKKIPKCSMIYAEVDH